MNPRYPAAAATLLLALGPGAAPEAASPPKGFDFCTTCHGAAGGGNVAIQAPALAGIEPWYLASRLQAYRDGARGHDYRRDPAGAEMRAAIRGTSSPQADAIFRYVLRLEGKAVQTGSGNDAARGRLLYEQHCATCHGTGGLGLEALHAPNLRRLNDWYLVSAWRRYQDAQRGQDANVDPAGAQMRAIAQALPDLDIASIAAHLTAAP